MTGSGQDRSVLMDRAEPAADRRMSHQPATVYRDFKISADERSLVTSSAGVTEQPRVKQRPPVAADVEPKTLHCIGSERALLELIDGCDVDDYDVLRLRAMPLDFMLRCYLCQQDTYCKGIAALKQHRLKVHDLDPDTYSVYKCFGCQHMTSSASKLKGHLEECRDLSVSLELVSRCLVVTDMNAFTQEEAEKTMLKQA